jgi:hypothetical protein
MGVTGKTGIIFYVEVWDTIGQGGNQCNTDMESEQQVRGKPATEAMQRPQILSLGFSKCA